MSESISRATARAYANAFGYFWLSCPYPGCGRMFGGHEAGRMTVPTDRTGISKICCKLHDDEYERLQREQLATKLREAGARITAPENQNPAVKHPAHYGGGDNPYEVIKVAEAWGLDKDAYLFNVLKYVGRAGKKDDILQDLEKAAEYIQFRMDTIKRERTAAFVFPTEPHSVISAQGHPCHDTDPDGRTKFIRVGSDKWMCDCSTWPETTIRQDLTDHRNEATI